MKSLFNPVSPSLLFTKNDPNDPRLGDTPLESTKTPTTFFIAGYPDDEGVFHNGGRLGAAQGPDSVRDRFYRMTPHPTKTKDLSLQDLGNLKTETMPLSERHQKAAETLTNHLKENCKWIGLGGGHDYGYAEGKGFLNACLKLSQIKPLILNFDAHLDVRPMKSQEKISSGTPFYRLLNEFKGCFDFMEIGIQPFCNSRVHWQWVEEQSGCVLAMDDFQNNSLTFDQWIFEALESRGWNLPGRPCFISVDIDGFSSAHAMGCSQSWPSGFLPEDFFPALQSLCNIFSVSTLGIYEVAPPLDQDQRTAKLAAEIMYRFIYA